MDGPLITEVRPHTGIPEPFVVSPAFVNAHSHLEYRGFLGRIVAPDYWGFIREITELKKSQTVAEIERDCAVAARENRATGVGLVAEHFDRPSSGAALADAGVRSVLFKEVITFFEREAPEAKLAACRESAAAVSRELGQEVFFAPHAPYTVDQATLRSLAGEGAPLSIHVAETEAENELFRSGTGRIAEFFRANGFEPPVSGHSSVATLASLGVAHGSCQYVHCCAVDDEDIDLIARAGVSVAHCPRSNTRLQCPVAPVRRLLGAGIRVGLGLDSAASGGPVDFFAEMREALRVSVELGEPLKPEQVWHMATEGGRHSLPISHEPWQIEPGSSAPLIAIHTSSATSIEEVILGGSPEKVTWVG